MSSDKYNTYVPSASEFIRRAYHGSAVLGNWLYIDGGEVKYNAGTSQAWELLNQTLSIDLSKNWINSSVEFVTTDRAALPLHNYPVLVPSVEENAIYSFGGTISFWVLWPRQASPVQPELWKFTPDNAGSGQWNKQSVDPSFPNVQPDRVVSTAGDGLGWMLGGEMDFSSYPQLDYGSVVPNPGMIQFNSSTGTWTNVTSKELTAEGTGTATCGRSHFVPTYGPEGIVITFGTIDPLLDVAGNATAAETPPMTTISVYEPQSRSWYRQTAGGPSIPSWRADFCIAGVPGDNGTYEIYIHGGTHWAQWGALNGSTADTLVEAETQLDTIYILSLPSFTWHQAEYTPVSSRSGHTCHITGTGNSQMLVVGGINFANELISANFAKQDVWSQGLGVFDLNELAWSESWDANADTYRTPQMIKDHIATAGPTPTQWDSSNLAAVFATSRSVTPSSTMTSTVASNPGSSSSTPVGAIVGGVVGGVVGLLAFGLLFWYCLIRRKRRQQPGRHHTEDWEKRDRIHHENFPVENKMGLHNRSVLQQMAQQEPRYTELAVDGAPIGELNATHKCSELPGSGHI